MIGDETWNLFLPHLIDAGCHLGCFFLQYQHNCNSTEMELNKNSILCQTRIFVRNLIWFAGCCTLFSPFSHWGKNLFVLPMGWFLCMKRKDWQCTCGLPVKDRPWKREGEEVGEWQPKTFLSPANHFSSHLSASLWALTPPPNCFRLKFLYSTRPCSPLLPRRSAHRGAFKMH